MPLTALPLFVTDAELALLEARAQGATGDAPLALAWALRQRDGARALELLPRASEGPWRWLVEAECQLLGGRLDAAEALHRRALAAFADAGDAAGEADAHWLGYQIALDRGDQTALLAATHAAIARAAEAGDAQRLLFMQASTARAELLRNRSAAQAHWVGRLPEHSTDPVCEAALRDFRGCLEAMGSNFPQAIIDFAAAFELALQTGQHRRAITLATNLGFAFTRAHDFESAIDWQRRALALARATGWPRLYSLCLAQTGEALRRLGELDEARELLTECLQTHAGEPDSRVIALARKYLAHLEMDVGDAAAGLAAFENLARHPAVQASVDLQIDTDQGLARALLGLHRLGEAEAAARRALDAAHHQQERGQSLEVLGLLAEIRLAQGDASQALQLYEQALAEADALPGYRPPPALLDGAARAHAMLGHYQPAFDMARRAIALRESSQSEQARRRSRAIHLQHQVDRARTESEHLRRLAAAESARSAALEDAHAVLQQLSTMGQELTAELDTERVLSLLRDRIGAMVDMAEFAVFLLDEGPPMPPSPASGTQLAPGDAPDPELARCARERRELLLRGGTDLLLMPLAIGGQPVGALRLRSHTAGAYGERELLILRNLAAYAAIALENARTYQRVAVLQRQVIAQERLAALGAMVAGVAHELNTPIGNSLLAATTLLASNRGLEARLDGGPPLRRSELVQQTRVTLDGLALIERSMQTAASLVSNFKQMAQQRGGHERLQFELATWCRLQLRPLVQRAEQAGHALDIDIPPDLLIDSYPDQLGQALEILVNNALLHGMLPGRPGRISITALPLPGDLIRLEVADDGRGMTADVLPRVFEPFFSTRFGQGGNGLGLAICHSLVEQVLGGHIQAHSIAGQGSRFVLDMPRVAP